MEDLLFIGGFGLLLIGLVYWFVSWNTKRKFKKEQERILNERIMEAGRKAQREHNLRKAELASMNTAQTPTFNKPKTTYTVQQPTSKSDDGFMDGVMTTIVLNNIMNSNNDVQYGTVTKNLDTNEVTYKDTSPSYVDSSPKSSWSGPDTSSSWSSSDSSSSYSSPSSDW